MFINVESLLTCVLNVNIYQNGLCLAVFQNVVNQLFTNKVYYLRIVLKQIWWNHSFIIGTIPNFISPQNLGFGFFFSLCIVFAMLVSTCVFTSFILRSQWTGIRNNFNSLCLLSISNSAFILLFYFILFFKGKKTSCFWNFQKVESW